MKITVVRVRVCVRENERQEEREGGKRQGAERTTETVSDGLETKTDVAVIHFPS